MTEHSQGEIPQKVQEAIKQLGHPASEKEILQIKANIREPTPVVEAPIELSDEQKRDARIKQLTDGFSRRELEEKLRTLGIEPTKQEYPDKQSLAKAVAEKEAEQ